MYVKISAPDKTIYEWEVTKITVPTEEGDITVLPNHQPLSSVVKPWILSLSPVEIPTWDEYVITWTTVNFSVSKWIVFVDGSNVIITTSAATTSPAESAEVLATMKADMQATLEKIKVEWSVEDLEKAMMNLEKVTADLRLSKLRHVG